MRPAKPESAVKRELCQALEAIVGKDALLREVEELRAFDCDALTAYRALPLLVVLPENEQQIVGIVKTCRQFAIPIVPRGAGTGLSGGAIPIEGCVVLATSRMTQIVNLDPLERVAVVQPGVRNLSVSQAAAPFGLFYAPDPSSQLACTVGGNVAENSGGVHCLKYGLTLQNLLRVRGVLASGEIVEIGSHAPDTPGLDLLPVITGSEGMMLVVTEVSLRLLPRPESARVILASFDSNAAAADAVASIIANGIIPAGLEMMDHATTLAVEAFVHAGYDLEAEALLLCESDGTAIEVEAEIARLEQLLSEAGARRVTVSDSEEERQKLWSGRKNAFPAAGRLAPDYYCIDGTVPRRAMAEILGYIKTLESHYGLRCLNVFHAGDGNLHPIILFNAAIDAEWQRAKAFGDDILIRCIELGGSITGEHGVGVEKLDTLCVQFGEAERSCFMALKAAFDPSGLLNPDKGIPSLRRCAEFGREHVHHGQRAFPTLERF
jgi:glycolate oxidase